MSCRVTQDRWVMVESSDKTWSTGEGNGKPLQYSCLENPMNSFWKGKKDNRISQKVFRKEKLSSSRIHCCCIIPAAAKSLQLCLTLCNPIDGSPSDSPVPRILQARTLEWVAISFSNAWKWKVKGKSLSHVRLLAGLSFFINCKKSYMFYQIHMNFTGSPCDSAGKEFACNVGDLGSIPGFGRSPGEENRTLSSILVWKILWMKEPGGL